MKKHYTTRLRLGRLVMRYSRCGGFRARLIRAAPGRLPHTLSRYPCVKCAR